MIKLMDPPNSQYRHDLSRYVGWRFGDFFVTGRWKRRHKCKAIYWEVQCTCGVESTYKIPSDILNQRGTSCKRCTALRNAKRGSDSPYWKGSKDIPKTMIASIKQSCKHRSKDIKCKVTVDDLQKAWDDSGGACAYTGWPLELGITASVDRINSDGDYTSENIQFVHKDINRMKSDFSEEYFLNVCTAVAATRGSTWQGN